MSLNVAHAIQFPPCLPASLSPSRLDLMSSQMYIECDIGGLQLVQYNDVIKTMNMTSANPELTIVRIIRQWHTWLRHRAIVLDLSLCFLDATCLLRILLVQAKTSASSQVNAACKQSNGTTASQLRYDHSTDSMLQQLLLLPSGCNMASRRPIPVSSQQLSRALFSAVL